MFITLDWFFFLVEVISYEIHTLFLSIIIAADTPPVRNLKIF